jgi:hypothetical protein
MSKKIKNDTPDVRITDSFSIFTFEPLTLAGQEWFKANVYSEPWQWLGTQLCVEPRYASDLIDGLTGDGLEVA